MNDMKNKKAEIIEIILITILISLSINLISSSIFALNEVKNIIIITIGIIICISIIVYYLKIKVKSMNVDKIINGNIILNIKNKKIYKSLEYFSSFDISDNITAVMLENKDINKKYKEALNTIAEDSKDLYKLKKSYFSYVINSAIEYQILDLLTDHIYLDDKDIKTIDLDNASKDI